MVLVLDLTGRRWPVVIATLAVALTTVACSPVDSSRGPSPTQTSRGTSSTQTPTGGDDTSVAAPADAQSARVRTIVDGDTMHLVASGTGPLPAGTDVRVRLLEINAPEIHGTVDCYGPEATSALSRLAPVGSTVRVIADRERQDKYGRPLLYVWNAAGVFINESVVRAGAARSLLIAPNDRYISVIRAAEHEAKNARRGQWSAC